MTSLRRFTPALLAAACFMAISTATRVALALRADAAFPASAWDWTRIFAYGFGFDLVTAGYLTAPFVLWLALVPNRVARSRAHRLLSLVLLAAMVFAALLLAISEWLFWDEFGSRFNFIAVDYLLYRREVTGNISESYPLQWILPAIAAATLALCCAWLLPLRRQSVDGSWRNRAAIAAVTTAFA